MSIFAKRHYEFLACTLHDIKPLSPTTLDADDYIEGRYELTRYNQWERMVQRLAAMLSRENRRFSPSWFINACKSGDMRRPRR